MTPVPDSDHLQTAFNVVIRFETELWNAVDGRLRSECDLPLSRLAPMQAIGRLAGCRVHDLAEELAMSIGGISKLIDRIEASGYCTRTPNPDDGRSSIIELTPRGRQVLKRAVAAFDDEVREQLGPAMIAAMSTSRPPSIEPEEDDMDGYTS